MKFEEYIDSLGLRYFTASEILGTVGASRNGVKNTMPHASIWPNVAEVARLVDHIRATIGEPIYINSSYRSPLYNKAVGGARNSQHLYFRALDIRAKSMPSKELFRVVKSMRDAGKFKGGLGLYPTFVHVDTRGSNVTW